MGIRLPGADHDDALLVRRRGGRAWDEYGWFDGNREPDGPGRAEEAESPGAV